MPLTKVERLQEIIARTEREIARTHELLAIAGEEGDTRALAELDESLAGSIEYLYEIEGALFDAQNP